MDVLAALLIPVILASAIVCWRAYSHASAIVSRRAYSQIKLKRLDLSECCLGFGWVRMSLYHLGINWYKAKVFLVAATVLATLAFGYDGLYLVISQPMSVLADAFVKAFIVFTVLKPLGSYGVFRRFLYFSLAIVSLLSIVMFILNFVQCKPWSALWRKFNGDYCWSPSIYRVLSTVRNSELSSFLVSISTQNLMQAWVLHSVFLSLWFHLRSSGICIKNGTWKFYYGSSYFLVCCEQISIF